MTQNPTSPEENLARLNKFALRLLTPPYSPDVHQSLLLPGSLPSDLPLICPYQRVMRCWGALYAAQRSFKLYLK